MYPPEGEDIMTLPCLIDTRAGVGAQSDKFNQRWTPGAAPFPLTSTAPRRPIPASGDRSRPPGQILPHQLTLSSGSVSLSASSRCRSR
jgi:hypothetical protein